MKTARWIWVVTTGLALVACGEESGEIMGGEQNALIGGDEKAEVACAELQSEQACVAVEYCAWEPVPGCDAMAIYPPPPCDPICRDTKPATGTDCGTVSSDGTINERECDQDPNKRGQAPETPATTSGQPPNASEMPPATSGQDPSAPDDTSEGELDCSRLKHEDECFDAGCAWGPMPACDAIAIYPAPPCDSVCYGPRPTSIPDCGTVGSDGTTEERECDPHDEIPGSTPGGPAGR